MPLRRISHLAFLLTLVGCSSVPPFTGPRSFTTQVIGISVQPVELQNCARVVVRFTVQPASADHNPIFDIRHDVLRVEATRWGGREMGRVLLHPLVPSTEYFANDSQRVRVSRKSDWFGFFGGGAWQPARGQTIFLPGVFPLRDEGFQLRNTSTEQLDSVEFFAKPLIREGDHLLTFLRPQSIFSDISNEDATRIGNANLLTTNPVLLEWTDYSFNEKWYGRHFDKGDDPLRFESTWWDKKTKQFSINQLDIYNLSGLVTDYFRDRIVRLSIQDSETRLPLVATVTVLKEDTEIPRAALKSSFKDQPTYTAVVKYQPSILENKGKFDTDNDGVVVLRPARIRGLPKRLQMLVRSPDHKAFEDWVSIGDADVEFVITLPRLGSKFNIEISKPMPPQIRLNN